MYSSPVTACGRAGGVPPPVAGKKACPTRNEPWPTTGPWECRPARPFACRLGVAGVLVVVTPMSTTGLVHVRGSLHCLDGAVILLARAHSPWKTRSPGSLQSVSEHVGVTSAAGLVSRLGDQPHVDRGPPVGVVDTPSGPPTLGRGPPSSRAQLMGKTKSMMHGRADLGLRHCCSHSASEARWSKDIGAALDQGCFAKMSRSGHRDTPCMEASAVVRPELRRHSSTGNRRPMLTAFVSRPASVPVDGWRYQEGTDIHASRAWN